jgi:predicted transcriptional regulator
MILGSYLTLQVVKYMLRRSGYTVSENGFIVRAGDVASLADIAKQQEQLLDRLEKMTTDQPPDEIQLTSVDDAILDELDRRPAGSLQELAVRVGSNYAYVSGRVERLAQHGLIELARIGKAISIRKRNAA